MAVVREYTRAFFDRYLKSMKSPVLDAKASNQLVEAVQRFGPASARIENGTLPTFGDRSSLKA
jgi:hypothetical protein